MSTNDVLRFARDLCNKERAAENALDIALERCFDPFSKEKHIPTDEEIEALRAAYYKRKAVMLECEEKWSDFCENNS